MKREVNFYNSPAMNELAGCDSKRLVKHRDEILYAIKIHQDTTYTDENGNEYKGSKFWTDALEYVNNKLKAK